MGKGHDFEKQVASWFTRQGFTAELNELVRGKVSKRAYEVDVHASKQKKIRKNLLMKKWIRYDVWVECKNLKKPVKRSHINALIRKAQDLKKGYEEGFEDWYADILMVFSTSGFDVDAIRIGNESDVYLVDVNKTYNFMGNMTKSDFNELIESAY